MDVSSARKPTRVVLADDHTMFREGLAGLLASHEGIEVVGSGPNGPEVLALAEREKPDMVIMQIETPLQKGKENLSRVLAISPRPKVLIVTMFENPRYVRDFLKLGASAYLMKSADVEDLAGAIRSVAQDTGQTDDIVVGIPQEALEMSVDGFREVLTDREMEVLLLAARGLSNRRIASSLYLSEATVSRHLANIYSKMGVGSRTQAAKKALAEGWVSIPEIVGETE
ncbi:MAG: response regulator transcription factor [Rubrobacteraceae bacterium]